MSAGVKSIWIIVVAGRIPGAVLDARAGQLMRRTRPRQPSTFGRVEYNELAANLASSDDAHLFGQNEFTIRAIAHRIAAKAVERHLAGKKTATKAPR